MKLEEKEITQVNALNILGLYFRAVGTSNKIWSKKNVSGKNEELLLGYYMINVSL
jgi:hypothetical protein